MNREPVFHAPWEAQVFALAVKLHERGLFTWPEWTDTLAGVIREAQAGGDPDLGDTYYLHWAKTLERMLARRGLADSARIDALAKEIEYEAQHVREAQRR